MKVCSKSNTSMLLLSLGLLIPKTGFSLVEVGAAGGKRSSQVQYDTSEQSGKKKTVSGTEISASVLLDPLPAIPVSFGITLQSASIDTSAVRKDQIEDIIAANNASAYVDASASSKYSSLLYGPVVKAWVPVPYVEPYLKLAYLMGSGVEKIDMGLASNSSTSSIYSYSQIGTQKYSQSGTEISVGMSFKPLPLIEFSLEYGMFSGTTKITDQNIDGVKVQDGVTETGTSTKDDLSDADKKARSMSATSIRLGLALSI